MISANETHQDSKAVETPNHVPQTALTVGHYDECIGKRELDPRWIIANCRSVTAKEAAQRLGYIAKSDGIWQEGCNHQSQFKPNKPWRSEGDKKAPKYRSQTGEYDAMLPTHPTNPRYWNDIEALKQLAYKVDGHPCLVVTEGFFKAIAGCANGIPTIALLGVEMGLTSRKENPQGRRYLVPALERYAKAGFGFIIAFDADCVENKNVVEAQRSLVWDLLHNRPDSLLEYLQSLKRAINEGKRKLSKLQIEILLDLYALSIGGLAPATWIPSKVLGSQTPADWSAVSRALKRLEERGLIVRQYKKASTFRRTTTVRFTYLGSMVTKPIWDSLDADVRRCKRKWMAGQASWQK